MTPALVSAPAAGVSIDVTTAGARSVPASQVTYQAVAHFVFDESRRQLAYDIRLAGTREDIAGVYLHRCTNRQNGGVAYVLAKSATPLISGTVTLTEVEVGDLKAGKFYLSVLSRRSPRLGARADLAFPSARDRRSTPNPHVSIPKQPGGLGVGSWSLGR